MIAYSSENDAMEENKEAQEVVEKVERKHKNQLLLSKEEIERMKEQ